MSYLLDTNILLRWTHLEAPDHDLAVAAVRALEQQEEPLFITPQNLVEFWGVATRPLAVNGLGLTLNRVAEELRQFLALFSLARDTPAIFDEWLHLAETVGVMGRQVHDARIAQGGAGAPHANERSLESAIKESLDQ